MKFTKLIINNFMRFKGENVIEFSCIPERNVTVILGDNTVGKTTLAQAIRWVLYGEVIQTQYGKATDVCLLNTDVLGGMTANDNACVSVELDFIDDRNDDTNTYRVIRKAMFGRKFPQMEERQISQSLKMYIKNSKTGEELPYDNFGKDQGKVDEQIRAFLPMELSSYFLFDGERWNDEKTKKNDIKDSIYTIVGVSPTRQMKIHLGELGTGGRSGVIKTLQSKISGIGTEFNEIQNKIEHLYENMEKNKADISNCQKEVDYYGQKAEEIENRLLSNPRVEQDQSDYKNLQKSISMLANNQAGYRADIIVRFSDSYTYFAAPLLEKIIKMLDGVDLKGIDLPGVTDKTIDKILLNHTCLCGTDITEGSKEERELLKLKRLVPPAVIGTLVGTFKDKLAKWNNDSSDMYEYIKKKADLFRSDYDEQLDDDERMRILERKIDNKINFAEERIKLNEDNHKVTENNNKIAQDKVQNTLLDSQIHSLTEKRDSLSAKSEDNKRIERYVAYATALYKSAEEIYESKTGSLLNNLNEIIRKNFQEMFNEQEKYAKLDDDYNLRLYYKKIDNNGVEYSESEASGLSEGEKIARNFAFIVSILELARNMKDDNEDAQPLPLVLDGPFSKLSDVNIAKVAGVMPGVAEQVIIFMLDKDWEPSGLSKYTDKKYMYRVSKNVDENSSHVTHDMEA